MKNFAFKKNTGRKFPKALSSGGFTLIEVMTTVVIVTLLGAIALPSYTQYVVRTNRSAVQSFMFSVANRQEQFLLDAKSYFCTAPNACTNLQMVVVPSSVAANYTVTVSAPAPAPRPTYLITATPIGTQAGRDTKCATMTLNQDGQKTKSGTASLTDCWK